MPTKGFTFIDPEQTRIDQQMQMANALRKQGMSGDTGAGMAGRVYTVGNPWGNIASAIGGQFLANQADKSQTALNERNADTEQQWLGQMPQATQSVDQFGPATPEGGSLPPVVTDKPLDQYADETRRWAMQAPQTVPGARQYALEQAMQAPQRMAELKDKAADRKAVLEATLAAKAEQADKERLARADIERQRQENKRDNLILAASLRPAPTPHTAIAYDKDGNGLLVDMRTGKELPLESVGKAPGGKGGQLPVQAQKMQSALQNLESGLGAYEKLLKQYNPRNADAVTPEKRAALSTAFGDLRMQLKEAYALGAITGPDMAVLEGVLTDPTGALGMAKGVISGNKAFEAQIEQSRAALNRQKRNFEQQYNLTLPEPAGTATAPMPSVDVPKFDAAKEARYQEWLRSQNK